ncbi:hypothetical protein J2T56_001242 [Natronobacillus azotifigens]
METLVSHYLITEHTQAIIPAHHINYQSIVYEQD